MDELKLKLDISKVQKRRIEPLHKKKTVIKRPPSEIVLENSSIKVVIDPNCGGKIRSFVSKKTNTEFLYQDTRKKFSNVGYSEHDISGFDECFPTVAACRFKTDEGINYYEDHGLLWQRAWDAEVLGDRVVMSKDIPQLKCCFERTCRLEGSGSLMLKYEISNKGDRSLPYIYSAHPLLSVNEQTVLELPDVNRIYMYVASDNSGFSNNTWVDLPLENDKLIKGPFSGKHERFVKFFTEQRSSGLAAVRRLDVEESLLVQFDTEQLPYLGVFVSEGFDSLDDGEFKGELLLALEPTTGIGDNLSTCESTGTLRYILPGQEISFWIRLTLRKD